MRGTLSQHYNHYNEEICYEGDLISQGPYSLHQFCTILLLWIQ